MTAIAGSSQGHKGPRKRPPYPKYSGRQGFCQLFGLGEVLV